MATTRKLCYPHPKGTEHVYIADGPIKGLHQTSGISHNWALDFMAPGGTPILAVEKGTIWRLSGHDPKLGELVDEHGNPTSVFGWSTYLQTPDGLMYYLTHQGSRAVQLGERVRKGQVIGSVGRWKNHDGTFDPGRSHTHLGVSHPMGDTASKRAIRNVAAAPHVTPVVFT